MLAVMPAPKWYIHTYRHTYRHTYVYTPTHLQICTCIYIYVYIHRYIYVHTYISICISCATLLAKTVRQLSKKNEGERGNIRNEAHVPTSSRDRGAFKGPCTSAVHPSCWDMYIFVRIHVDACVDIYMLYRSICTYVHIYTANTPVPIYLGVCLPDHNTGFTHLRSSRPLESPLEVLEKVVPGPPSPKAPGSRHIIQPHTITTFMLK